MPGIITNDGVTLYFEESGLGQPILLIGGWMMSTLWWRKQIPVLSEKYRVIAVDMRGVGESEKPVKGHRIARYARDVFDVIETLGLEEVTLVGWSMGAAIVMSYLDIFGSHRLKGVVFVDQTPKIQVGADWTLGINGMTADGVVQFASSIQADPQAFVLTFIANMFVREQDVEEVEWMKSSMLRTPPKIATRILIDLGNLDMRDLLPTITIPVLVTTGRQSKFFSYESSVYISEQVPNARLIIFEQSGHCPFYEEPEKFNAALVEFVG
jgi:pimeloyl-ACP methyl ester carboxylesterase